MDDREWEATKRAYALVAAYAFTSYRQDPEHIVIAPNVVKEARAEIEEHAETDGICVAWERAANDIALLAGDLLIELAAIRGISVSEEMQRRKWGL